MDEDPPMDGVCEEAETGGDTLGFPFSLSLSLSDFFEKIRVFLSFKLLRLREAGEQEEEEELCRRPL